MDVRHAVLDFKSDAEIIGINIQGDPGTILQNWYRSLSISVKAFPQLQELENILTSIMKSNINKNLVLLEDFYFPWFTGQIMNPLSRQKNLCHELIDLLSTFNLKQLVEGSTHIKGNTLDLVCLLNSQILNNLTIIEPGVSDHYMVCFEYQIELPLVSKEGQMRKTTTSQTGC